MTINYISYWQIAYAQGIFVGLILVSIGITIELQKLWSKLFTHYSHTKIKNITINDENGKTSEIITRCECGHKSYYIPMSKLGSGRPKKNKS